MVMRVDLAKIDEEGRVLIPKKIRERKRLEGEIELVETDDGVLLRPKFAKGWNRLFENKIRVAWKKR
jgi:AbrB family looped-hinge helix DNA binding protein